MVNRTTSRNLNGQAKGQTGGNGRAGWLVILAIFACLLNAACAGTTGNSAPPSDPPSDPPALQVTTSSLPGGQVGSPYQATTLTATGGTTPYTWSVTVGLLPTGLILNAGSGVISGTPTQASDPTFTVQAKDANNNTAIKSLSIDVTASSSSPSITTASLPAVQVGEAYSTTLEASGGTSPYTWSIVSGLPAGLTLTPSNGQITGAATTADPYTVNVKVTDSSSPAQTATKALGLMVWSDSGNSSTVWSIQTTATGWKWVAPSGWAGPASFCRANGVDIVDNVYLQSAGTDAEVLAKYGGSRAAEAQAWSNRLQSLGFNFAGEFSFLEYANWQSGMMPFDVGYENGDYTMDDGHPYHVKNVVDMPYPNGQVCATSTYAGGNEADVFDPQFPVAANALMANAGSYYGSGQTLLVIPDDGDYLFGLNTNGVGNGNAHADLAYFILTGPPFRKVSDCGDCNSTGGYHYANQTVYAKEALRDALVNEYLCTGAGSPVSTCTAAHFGTGSADPSSSSYVGASNASSALSALNSAWGTSYTTWNTSDTNGLAGIANGTYTSWGGVKACIGSGNPYPGCTGNGAGNGISQGTGLLDENGSNIIPKGFNCGGTDGNGPLNTDNWTNQATTLSDLHTYFVSEFAMMYAKQMQSGYKSGCGSSCPPLSMPVYDGPPYVYQAMAGFEDLFLISAPTADVQGIINNDGGVPALNVDYSVANADSWAGGGCPGYTPCYLTQALRGAAMAGAEQSQIAMTNPNGKHAVIGFTHWAMFDQKNVDDWGLATPNDNLYDGSAASTALSSGACATSHAYSQPAICQDPNGNSEGLAITSCTSGATAPSWEATYGGVTLDGTCQWVNEGSYTRISETSNWGDAILPLYTEAQTGMCDTN